MKVLFIITLISFSTLNISAQTMAMTPQKSEVKTTKEEDKALLKKRHTRAATQQIQMYLQEHLTYTQDMRELLVEGEFEVIVSLKPNGKIAKIKMGKNQSPVVHHTLKQVMGKFQGILYRGPRYEGASQIHIPIKFSVR